MHEVGHTLGLRHNFRGSAGANAAQLANRSWTASHGFGVSVMDYSPPALALDPARQGDYYAPTIGSYDRWAITYGYADVVTGAARRARRQGRRAGRPASGRPTSRSTGSAPSPRRRRTRRTCTAPTRTPGSAASASIPPSAATTRPTTRSAGRAGGSRSSTGCSTRSRPGSWRRARATAGSATAFTDLLNDRWYALLVTTKYLGGATTSRDHRGDPGARPAVVNVPAAQQRAALAFLADAAFGERAYRFPPALLEPARGGPVDALGRVTGRGRAARLSRCTTGR